MTRNQWIVIAAAIILFIIVIVLLNTITRTEGTDSALAFLT